MCVCMFRDLECGGIFCKRRLLREDTLTQSKRISSSRTGQKKFLWNKQREQCLQRYAKKEITLDSRVAFLGQNMGILGGIKKKEFGLVCKSRILVTLCHDKKKIWIPFWRQWELLRDLNKVEIGHSWMLESTNGWIADSSD